MAHSNHGPMARLPNIRSLPHRHHVAILVVAGVATAVGGYLTSKLSLQSDLADMLPDRFESVKAVERMKQEVGGVGELRVVVETGNFAAATAFAEALEPKLLASPYVNYVDYKRDVAFYKRNALLFLDMAELDSLRAAIQNRINAEKQRLNPFYVADLFGDDAAGGGDELAVWEARYRDRLPDPYYMNSDSTVLVIKVLPAQSSADLSFVRDMFKDVQRIVTSEQPETYDAGMRIYYGGNIKSRLEEYDRVTTDILGTALYGFSGVFLLIVFYFRRLLGAVLITVSLLFSLAWTFGLTYLVIGELNTITGFLFVILFGLGIDYGIHTFARYVESRRAGLPYDEAIEKTVGQTGKALATTAVTTAAAFFSLTLMDFKGFSDLGFIAGVGMLFALVAMVIVLPACITLVVKLGLLNVAPTPRESVTFRRRPFRYATPIVLAGGVVTALAGYGVTRVGFEYDFTNLRATTEERQIVGEKTRGIFKLSESPAVILADSRQEVEDIVTAVLEKIKQDTLSPTIETVRSIFSLVPEDQVQRLGTIRAIRRLVEDEADGIVTGEDKRRIDELKEYLRVDQPFTWGEFPQQDKRQFITRNGEVGNFVFVYPGVPLRDGRNAIEFRNDAGTITTAAGKVFHAASSNIILADMLIIMIREGKIAVALTFVIVFLIVLADFRNLRAALLVLTPLAFGMVWMGGIMYLIGMKVNFFNIVVLPSVIGIGVDNGVHIYHRYLEEGPGSLYFVLRNTGVAIAMTTLTTIVGYSGLILAGHPGLNSIGDLAVIGLTATFLTAVIILPALVQVSDERATTTLPGGPPPAVPR